SLSIRLLKRNCGLVCLCIGALIGVPWNRGLVRQQKGAAANSDCLVLQVFNPEACEMENE
ncbi:Hypothetical predicted protein, partial [Podarcis lilfordi]